jgi:exodeoxyribonuclease VII large subunit
MSEGGRARPGGIPGSKLPGPFPVGIYAQQLRDRMRAIARVQLFGDIINFRRSRGSVFFELRDAQSALGGLSCAMWLSDFDRCGIALTDGVQVVVAGGCDFYPGGTTSSPWFSFRVSEVRLVGEGDLLLEIERRRRELAETGLLEAQKWLLRPSVPASIGVVTARTGKARGDFLAALRRRGWAGRLVWAFAPVQDRHAAPAIVRALQDLATVGRVEVIIVARGGGSMMDLMAFSDDTLCRTVALLSVPVIASIGHHTDRTLLDDVSAVSCSTPTHAAEAAVPAAPREAQEALRRQLLVMMRVARTLVADRESTLGYLSAAVDSHDPHRMLQRGFALVERPTGEPISKATEAAGPVRIKFHDGTVDATVAGEE